MAEPPSQWDDLRVVLAIARAGSLSGATASLHVSHATLFRHINRIERSLGVRLFDRARDGYAPTPAGEEMAAAAQRIEAEIDALGRRIVGQDLRPSGIVRVTTTDTLLYLDQPTLSANAVQPPMQAKGNVMAKNQIAKNTICLWYDKDAEAAAGFYAATFPDSAVGAVHRAPSDNPSGKAGDVLVVEFTVAGVPCIGLDGGPAFKHNEAFSFQIATDDQAETDRYWNAIVGNGGQESQCGWCKDRWGVSWQITPRVLTEALAAGGDEAKRAFDAMMTMQKIDVAAIEAARRGSGAKVAGAKA